MIICAKRKGTSNEGGKGICSPSVKHEGGFSLCLFIETSGII